MLDIERERQGEGDDVEADWGRHPEDAAATVTHHACILRNKRMLLLYTHAPAACAANVFARACVDIRTMRRCLAMERCLDC